MNARPQTDAPVTAADLLGMGRHPGPFRLLFDAMSADEAMLDCTAVVRVIPGKRLVCTGEWCGREVFIKLYHGNDRYWRKELRGLNALHAGGIAAPGIVHAGTADRGRLHIILLEPVRPAMTLEAAWNKAVDEQAQIELLMLAAGTIALHHLAGLQQQDIHLDNFLLSGNRLYTLDGGGIHVAGQQPLPARPSLGNLALFFAQFYPQHDHLIERVLPEYFRQRHWDYLPLSGKQMRQRVGRARGNRVRRFLKKTFRDCSAFVCDRGLRYYRVCDRTLLTPAMACLLADPDASLDHPDTRYLKQGNTCTLWVTRVDGRDWVVKRYNIKGYAHRISRMFRRTRAALSWKNAHRLAMYGILTARPVALIETRFGPLRGRAWYVSEYVEGEDITRLCNHQGPVTDEIRAVGRQVARLLKQLAQCRLVHGDMKGTNIILSKQGPVVIDLDAMQAPVCAYRYRRLQRRDMSRFMQNWEDCVGIAAMFRQFLGSDK